MGYETRRTIRIDFEDLGEGGGTAFLRFRSLTFQEYQDAVSTDDIKASTVLAGSLVEWDFELDGEPIPCTAEGINSLDVPLRNLVLTEWIKAVQGTADAHPLARRSNDGVQAPSMTMDDL